MTQLDSVGVAAAVARPRSLNPASLWRRAIVGLLVLILGTAGGVWLYHTAIVTDASAVPSAINADRVPGDR